MEKYQYYKPNKIEVMGIELLRSKGEGNNQALVNNKWVGLKENAFISMIHLLDPISEEDAVLEVLQND